MELKFRQGIVRRQSDLTNTPIFIQRHALDGRYLDLVVSPDPTVITFAHMEADYLVEEIKTVSKAWGPLEETGQTQYLYWDISLLDASLTRGFSIHPPIISANEPPNPAEDQHWFDMSTTTMKVWIKNKWQTKIRVFAAIYDRHANVVPYPIGTHVGINKGSYFAGNIMLGKNHRPLRDSDGTFVTTESKLIISQTSSESVKFDTTLAYAEAAENIPQYSLVSLIPGKKIALASFHHTTKFVNGIVTTDLNAGEVGNIVSNGVVRNEQWNFPTNKIGRPVFCGPTGEVTMTPPISGTCQQVGFVYDVDSIYVNILSPVIVTLT